MAETAPPAEPLRNIQVMTWTERHPDPGPAPAHPGPDVGPEQNLAAWETWWQLQMQWNAYVRAHRLHQLAVAVDQLLAKEQTKRPPLEEWGLPSPVELRPEERIALVIGVMHLDGSSVLTP